jgi:hypothetical protein
MPYMARRSNRMQKNKFGVMSPGALLVESRSVLTVHETYYDHVLRHRCAGMHYVTGKSHQMQKHKFNVMCPSVLFLESVPVLHKHEK